MRYVLGPAGRRALGRFTRSRPLLAFDYDGTLAPIVSDPARAAVRAGTRELLTRLAARYVCVVVSGRPRRDLVRRLAGVGLAEASEALATALKMPAEEQQDRMRAMRAFVAEFNVYRWAGRMLVDAARLRRQERLTGRLRGLWLGGEPTA